MAREHLFCILAATAVAGAGAAWAAQPKITVDCTLGPKSLDKDYYQMAVWVEDDTRRFLDTLYVTNVTGREGLGNGYIKVFGIDLRSVPEALPVWAYARNVRYGKSVYPPKNKPLPDGITGATVTSGQFVKTFAIPEAALANAGGRPLVLCMEINVSRDGVPSMVFKAAFDPGAPGPADLKFVGYGDEQGRNGNISPPAAVAANPADYLKSGRMKVEK